MRGNKQNLDAELEMFVDTLISRFCVDSGDGYYLPAEKIFQFRDDLAALWFKKTNYSLDYIFEDLSKDVLGAQINRMLRGEGDREENVEDVSNSISRIIFDFYKYDIQRYIEERCEEYQSNKMLSNGFKKKACEQTGAIEWR